MKESEKVEQITNLEKEIMEKKKQLAELRKSVPDKKVENYKFPRSTNQEVTLLDLFGDKNELIVIHNMGKSCSYCTMWADGFNGIFHHIIGKASFVVSSPDAPKVQENFAVGRKWQFPMISIEESTFAEDMGFQNDEGYYPGVSIFYKNEHNDIYLHSQAPFGPGDDYCVTWPLFDLLPSGVRDVKVQRKLNPNSSFQLTNNIAIGVKNFREALEFYQKTLGMQVEQNYPNETKLSISGTNFFIENSNSDNNVVFFEFSVESMEEAMRLLIDKDCVILNKNENTFSSEYLPGRTKVWYNVISKQMFVKGNFKWLSIQK